MSLGERNMDEWAALHYAMVARTTPFFLMIRFLPPVQSNSRTVPSQSLRELRLSYLIRWCLITKLAEKPFDEIKFLFKK